MQHGAVARIQAPISFPPLVEDYGSLTALEKSLLGHFILLAYPKLVVELGVYKGITTQFICQFLVRNGIDTQVVGFDLPDVVARLRDDNLVIKHLENSSRLELIGGRLPGSLEGWLRRMDRPIDLALIDATHDYRSVSAELNLLFPRLSGEGYILCHDYSEKYDGVRYAVDLFAARHKLMVIPLTSSASATKGGYSSELVALCHRTYARSFARRTHHHWMKIKADLLSVPWIDHLWKTMLRPIVRKGRK